MRRKQQKEAAMSRAASAVIDPVLKFVQGNREKAQEVASGHRGVRLFKHGNGTTTVVTFGKLTRKLGPRIDLKTLDRKLPLWDGDRYVFWCTMPPEEPVMDIPRSRLLSKLESASEDDIQFDQVSNVHWVNLKDLAD